MGGQCQGFTCGLRPQIRWWTNVQSDARKSQTGPFRLHSNKRGLRSVSSLGLIGKALMQGQPRVGAEMAGAPNTIVSLIHKTSAVSIVCTFTLIALLIERSLIAILQ